DPKSNRDHSAPARRRPEKRTRARDDHRARPAGRAPPPTGASSRPRRGPAPPPCGRASPAAPTLPVLPSRPRQPSPILNTRQAVSQPSMHFGQPTAHPSRARAPPNPTPPARPLRPSARRARRARRARPPLSPRSRSPCLFLSKLGDPRRPLPRGGPARPSATQPHNTAPPATHPPSDAHRLHTVRPRTRTRTRTRTPTTRTTIRTTRIRTDALRTSPAWAAARLASFDGGKLQSPAANLLI